MRAATIARWLGVGLTLVAACSKAGDESQARRAPIPPPPIEVKVPADLRITVQVDGVDAPAITAAALGGLAPDYSDHDHHAWRLTRLVPAFDRDGEVIEARGAQGVALKLERPASDQAPQPVLFLTRRGDVAVTVIDPANPFPEFHGQGGRLKRQGDPMPRIQPVVALAVSRARATP
jgi:hypothetical protein